MERKWYHFPLQILTFIGGWIYVLIPLTIFNILFNGFWLIKIILAGKLKEVRQLKRSIETKIDNIKTFVFEYSDFKYKFDGIVPNDKIPRDQLKWYHMWPTWVPLVIVYLYRGRRDNCDGSEKISRWLYKTLLKNHPSYKNKIHYRKCIYVPYIPKYLDKVHYFSVLSFGDTEVFHNREHICFSVGLITDETKDQLAIRYRHGDERYIWLKW